MWAIVAILTSLMTFLKPSDGPLRTRAAAMSI